MFAQENRNDEEIIKVETRLLNIPVIVGDRNGRYLAGLKKENFYIVENEVKRPIDFFADDSAPMNVAILNHTSSSTDKILGNIKAAARDFIRILRPEDKALVATFNSTTKIWSDFSSDQIQLKKAIDTIKSTGNSVMFDAMYLLVKKYFAPLKGRKAIIVLTDGFVAGNEISENVLLNELTESEIMVYPLLFSEPISEELPKSKKVLFKYAIDSAFNRMNQYSLITGGKSFEAGKTNSKTAFRNIADELKKQYVVGIYPTNDDEKKVFRIGLRYDPKIFDPSNIVLRIKRVIRFKPISTHKNNWKFTNL